MWYCGWLRDRAPARPPSVCVGAPPFDWTAGNIEIDWTWAHLGPKWLFDIEKLVYIYFTWLGPWELDWPLTARYGYILPNWAGMGYCYRLCLLSLQSLYRCSAIIRLIIPMMYMCSMFTFCYLTSVRTYSLLYRIWWVYWRVWLPLTLLWCMRFGCPCLSILLLGSLMRFV
jgi:hypothetical protein